MQREIINFKGVTLTPYDDNSPDGQLAFSDGVELYNGSLRPSALSGTRSKWAAADGASYKLMHIHTTPSYSHYIFLNQEDGCVYWAAMAEYLAANLKIDIPGLETVTSVNSVGNTLAIFTDKGIVYALYDNGIYKHIGMQPPELDASFGLDGEWVDTSYSEEPVEMIFDQFTHINIKDETHQLNFEKENGQRDTIASKAFGAIAKAIQKCTETGRFCQPFFVRAAYRRFDGSYTKLSPPVLMIPDSTGPKAVLKNFTYKRDGNNKVQSVNGYIFGRTLSANLVLRALGDTGSLLDWADIISGVDIFATPAVDLSDTEGEAVGLYGHTYTFGDKPDLEWSSYIEAPYSYGYFRLQADLVYKRHLYQWLSDYNIRHFILPLKTDKEVTALLASASQFYKIASLSLSEYAATPARGSLSLSVSDLGNITLHESLPDSSDYQSHDTIIARQGFVYNKRLHLYDVDRKLFNGFHAEAMFPYVDDGYGAFWETYVYINTDDGIDRCVYNISTTSLVSMMGQFFYYPNPDAYKMVIHNVGTNGWWVINLQPHPFLNGAYAMWWGWMNQPVQVGSPAPQIEDAALSTPGKMYTSEVSNPFYFPLEGIYTVGVGKILGMSSVATALSQGQFGQFPLILFCTDGNYALSVDSEGYYSAVHPTQRDVCINPQSIIQTDSEILYMSSRGVMRTDGTSVNCISEDLDGIPDTLPENIVIDILPPQEQPQADMENSLIAYDYVSRRILFFINGKNQAYVYSIKDGTWSTAHFGQVKAVMNVYPYAYIQFVNGEIIRLDDVYQFSASAGKTSGVVYTRPVKLSSYQRKRIHQIAIQGVFTDVQELYIYASNDGNRWLYIGKTTSVRKGAMRGHPFKYYRFALRTTLSQKEHITAIKLDYDILPGSKLI